MEKQKEEQIAMERSGVRHGVNEEYPVFILSTDFWESFKAYETQVSAKDSSALIVIIILGIMGLGIIKSQKRTLKALWFAIIGLMELYYFLFYHKHPAWFFYSIQPLWVKLLAIIIVAALIALQLGVHADIDIPDGLRGDERAKAYNADLPILAALLPIGVYLCGWVASRLFHSGWLTSAVNIIGICVLALPVFSTNPADNKSSLLDYLKLAVTSVFGYAGFLIVFSYCPLASLIGIVVVLTLSSYKEKKSEVAGFRIALKNNPNDSETIRKLGNAYLHGEGVKRDVRTGMRYLNQAAELGSAKAYCNMAAYYYKNDDGMTDPVKALELAHKSLDMGCMDACLTLSSIYHEIYPDWKKSFDYAYKGAIAGIARCQTRSGIAFENGEGTEKNLDKAMYWFKKVADNEAAEKKERGFCSYRYGRLRYQSGDKGEGRWYIKQAQRFGYELALKYGNRYLEQ